MKGKPQRKCSTHQILSILLAVLTHLFWRPLSVNHLHLTNLIQHFLEMFPSQYPARWHWAHRRAGSIERTQMPLIFMTITNKNWHLLCYSAFSLKHLSPLHSLAGGHLSVHLSGPGPSSRHTRTRRQLGHKLWKRTVRQGETGSQYGWSLHGTYTNVKKCPRYSKWEKAKVTKRVLSEVSLPARKSSGRIHRTLGTVAPSKEGAGARTLVTWDSRLFCNTC